MLDRPATTTSYQHNDLARHKNLLFENMENNSFFSKGGGGGGGLPTKPGWGLYDIMAIAIHTCFCMGFGSTGKCRNIRLFLRKCTAIVRRCRVLLRKCRALVQLFSKSLYFAHSSKKYFYQYPATIQKNRDMLWRFQFLMDHLFCFCFERIQKRGWIERKNKTGKVILGYSLFSFLESVALYENRQHLGGLFKFVKSVCIEGTGRNLLHVLASPLHPLRAMLVSDRRKQTDQAVNQTRLHARPF